MGPNTWTSILIYLFQNFWAPYVNNGAGRVLGLTASVIDQRNCKVESLRLQLRDLEKCLLCKIGVVILVDFLCMT